MSVSNVLIIGGGLAGPSLAIALARRHIRARIFELRESQGDSGGSISLAPNALRALDSKVYEQVRQTGYLYDRIGVYDETGYHFGSFHGERPGGQYKLVRIMRSALHSILMKECNALGIEITYGVKLKEVSETEQGVVATFEDGSQAQGDILVGADGIHSAVRKHVLGTEAPATIWSGSVTVNGFMEMDQIDKPADLAWPASFLTPSGVVSCWPIDEKQMAWGVSQPIEEKSREEFKELEAGGEALQMVKDSYSTIATNPIRSLLDNTKKDGVRLWTPYSIPDLPIWHKGRVVLIGDAGHALPPNGQGSAMAFEDAAFLARLLASDEAKTKSITDIFAAFERSRRSRIELVKKISGAAGKAKASTPNALIWSLKKWAIWAWFAWNRFEIRDMRISSFDVMSEPLGLE